MPHDATPGQGLLVLHYTFGIRILEKKTARKQEACALERFLSYKKRPANLSSQNRKCIPTHIHATTECTDRDTALVRIAAAKYGLARVR